MATQQLGTALITGASTGIGAVYADRLARRGYDLVLVARDEARLTALAERLGRETCRKVEWLKADLTAKADLALVEQRLREDESLTVLVNNAGMSVAGTLVEGDIDRFQTMIELNVIAPTRLAAAAARNFAARKVGAIINIASVLALAPELFNGSYSGTKAYVLNLSLSLQKELEAAGVRVQAVLPGATRTEIWARAGVNVDGFPPEMIMEVDDMVDAALAGFDQGELVTIPSLPDPVDFERYSAARLALGPNLSRNRPAERYRTVRADAA
ncbi:MULTISPECIES: SDR family oxidoreductase [unclassified Bosea (in: a-proteobacteria)]|uniref:SDR family NAD(P)-dependent oxidoreductase n=1 Tax=unclassified Bosea (in: a-proteobacteria) TaxID=2653178 RepID=UPI000F75E7DB|nr:MULTISPECIES: SDR family oxidoreductase [unclassified Bosea (in: a-proteobacteria)]AZO76912.1 SDR family oxidoreductase [Bosea sp. Tri-49]RXT21750.1 SDR family oxidoreductase [Bosea sp. Tri-39]RXT32089.1 SDR family oxidoreductase [Bosea sp. Tri-54]